MPRHRLSMEADVLRRRVQDGDPYWPAQVTIALAIALNLGLTDRVTIGPSWVVPAVEGVLLAVLVADARGRANELHPRRRRFGLTVVGLVSVTNIASLVLLTHFLVNGGHAGGHALIGSGLVLWVTNVLLFGVWFWEVDGGGPVHRHLHTERQDDFRFPTTGEDMHRMPWRPGFADYLYTSLTNAMAFSPTDTMPLTVTAKALMALQELTALTTLGLVVARAVNILG